MESNFENNSADKILYNAKIVSGDEEGHIYEAVAIKDGRILSLGSDKKILARKNAATELINLHGRTVIPGLVESHTHFSDAALSELDGELFIPKSVKELLEYIKAKVKETAPGEWLYFRNTYPTRLDEYRFPTLEELDAAAPENPVYVSGYYAGQVNSCALKTMEIDEYTIPVSGKLCRDKNTGKLNGTLFLCGYYLSKYLKSRQYTGDETVHAIRMLQKSYSSLGITSIIDGATSVDAIKAYNLLYSGGDLNMRVVYTCYETEFEKTGDRVNNLYSLVDTPPEWGKLGFLKTTVDGGILTGTSYMRESYGEGCSVFGIDDSDFRGIVLVSKKQLTAYIRKSCETNLQMTAHCVGDAAVDVFLSAYEEVNADISIPGRRFSIIHADFTSMETLEKIKSLGLILLSQPAWHYMDGSILDRTLQPDTMKTFLPYRDMDELGVQVCAGSDHMVKHDSFLSVNPYNPFLGMYNLVTRKTCRGDVIGPEQKISRQRALQMYTLDGAYASFDENMKGSLEAGKFADLAVLNKDYLTCPEEEIPYIESVLTIVGGKVVYRKEDLPEPGLAPF